MNKKAIRIIFAIVMIMFLPITYYLIQNDILSIFMRNILFFILLATYSLSINFLVKDKNLKNKNNVS